MSDARPEALVVPLEAAAFFPPLSHYELAATAWSANARGDWAEALNLWTALRDCAPDWADGYIGACHALREAGRIDEADAVGAAGAARFHTNPHALAAYAWVAMTRQDWDEAALRWQVLRGRLPDLLDGHTGLAQALRYAGRHGEAEAVCAEALARFPQVEELLVEYAWLAMIRHDWNEAVLRWQAFRDQFPERLDGHIGLVQALRYAGRRGEAEAVCAAAFARAPHAVELLIEYAWLATERWNWEEALRRWQAASEQAPDRAEPQIWRIGALRLLGRLDEADAAASEALARFPDNTVVLTERVKIALYRGDRDEAFARLNAARDHLTASGPLDAELSWVDYRQRRATHGSDVTREAENGDAADAETASGLSAGELMLSFEGLGRNCDFGVVQHLHGVEPLGLLRYANVSYNALLTALEARFAGIGGAEETAFSHHNNDMGEYMVSAMRYGFTFHTYVYHQDLPTAEDREKFFARHCQRLGFLRDKLLTDLGAAEKILLYANYERLSDADIERLHDAVGRYGANYLLCIRPAETGHPDGSVETLRPGLFVGYLGRFADFRAGEKPPLRSWCAICDQAYQRAVQHGFVRAIADAGAG